MGWCRWPANTLGLFVAVTRSEVDKVSVTGLQPRVETKLSGFRSELPLKITDLILKLPLCKSTRQQPKDTNRKPLVWPSCLGLHSRADVSHWPCAPLQGRWAPWWHSCCGWCTPPSRSALPASLPSILDRSAGRTGSRTERSTAEASGWRASPALQGPRLRGQRTKVWCGSKSKKAPNKERRRVILQL